MSPQRQAGSGHPRHAPRPPSLGDRLLAAGVGIVREQGLDAGLGSLSFEEAIRRSGVSRASAYRRWSTREAFADEVLLELARGLDLDTGALAELPAAVAEVIGDGTLLATPAGRRDALVEMFRRLVERDFADALASPAWRTHLAIASACASLRDGDLREGLRRELGEVEERRADRRARVYAQWCALAGYRLVAPLQGPAGFRQMSWAAGAVFAGCLVTAQLDPRIAAPGPTVRAFGSTRPAPWSPQAYTSTALLLSHVEPDPGVVWDAARVEEVVAGIRPELFR